MLDVQTPEVFAAQIIFWALLPIMFFARPHWAVLAWLTTGNLDLTGPGFASTGAFGLINVAKGIGIPLFLCWRFRSYRSEALSTIPVRLWLGLAAYAAIASLWTPFPLAGVKLVGNMIGLVLTIVVLEKAARGRMLSKRIVTLFMMISLVLGVVQTYVFGGVVYGYDGPDEPVRFSSFIHAQQYSSILVAFLAVALWHYQFTQVRKLLLVLIIGAALGLNGSRTWFIGAVFVVSTYCWVRFRQVASVVAFTLSAACLFAFLLLNFMPSALDFEGEAPGRMVATVKAIVSGTDTAQRAGLRNLNFRLIVYDNVVHELQTGTLAQLVFGHGTSSGGALALRVFPYVYKADHLDANRTIHDEWLRALYEWGITGLILLISVFATLLYGLGRRYRRATWKPPVAALLSFLPAFLAALSTENVLAGAGTALAFSLAMLIAMLWLPMPEYVRNSGVHSQTRCMH